MPCTMVETRNTTANKIDTAPALRKLCSYVQKMILIKEKAFN